MSAARPVLIFDGDCRFCRRWIARWRKRTRDRVAYIPFQRLGDRFPGLSRDACATAVQWIEPDGRTLSGADAILRLFDFGLPGGPAVRTICSNPPIIWMLRLGYSIVARNRIFFSKITRAFRRRTRKKERGL